MQSAWAAAAAQARSVSRRLVLWWRPLARRTGSARRVTVQVEGKAPTTSAAELGTVTAVRAEQFKKAYLPMEVRLSGKVTAVRAEQS